MRIQAVSAGRISAPTPFLRRALAAALVASSTLAAGCHRTVVVAPSELPRLVAAQAEGGGVLEVVDVDGKKRKIRGPVDEVTIVPVRDLVFMQPPGADRVFAVAPRERRRMTKATAGEPWRDADLTVRSPFAATADAGTVTLTQLPGGTAVETRTVRVPAAHVRGVQVQQLDGPATVGAALGITAGAAAVTFGVLVLIAAAAGDIGGPR